MAGFNNQNYHRGKFTQYMIRHNPEWTWEVSDKGLKYRKFNFRKGLQKSLIDDIVMILKKHGFNKQYIFDKWQAKTGITKKRAKDYFIQKHRSLTLWELEHLLHALDFELILNYKGERTFSHSHEKGRIIILCHKNPQFIINMNAEDPYDFSVEFMERRRLQNLEERKAYQVFKEACVYYFIDCAKKEKLPYTNKKMTDVFKGKYHRGEMYIKN